MGRDIHVRILKYNTYTNFYEEIALYKYKNEEYSKVDPYDCRNYEMFDGMTDGDDKDGYGNFPWSSVKLNSYCNDFRNEINEKMRTSGYYDFHEMSLSALESYVIKHPFVTDYDVDDEEFDYKNPPKKENPIRFLFENIVSYISFIDYLDIEGYDSYKIVFYFDC